MKKYIYTPLLLLGVALGSCNHKDLCYMEMEKCRIVVEYDWRDAPDATAGGMCVFFYPEDNTGTYYRFDFANTKGGEIEIPAGKYRLITYNNDTEKVRFSNTNVFDGHTAYTREGDLLEPLYGNGVTSTTTTTNGERVCITPDGLWGCRALDVTVSKHEVSYSFSMFDDSRADRADDGIPTIVNTQTITLYPHDMLCHYSYEVRNVENIKNLSKVSAALSGMSGSMSMADESLDSEKVTLPVPGRVDTSTDKITGRFLTFGHSDDNTVPHRMIFFVVMNDGSKYRIEGTDKLDVTTQVDNAPDRRHVHIIIDGLRLPDSDVVDDSWDVSVDDWGIHEEELKI